MKNIWLVIHTEEAVLLKSEIQYQYTESRLSEAKYLLIIK